VIEREKLPDHWEVVPLRRILRKLARPLCSHFGVVTAYRDGVVTLRSSRRAEGYTVSDTESGYQGVEHGDLVFHALDGFAGAVGVSDASGKCTPVYHVCEAPHGDDLRFVAQVLRAMGSSGFLALQSGTVRQRSVDFRTWDALGRIAFPRPPREEQRALVEFLDRETNRIDAVVKRKRTLVSLLDERRIAATDALILGEKASTRPVAALANYVNGWAFKPDDFTPSGLPVVRISQLTDDQAAVDLYDGDLPDSVRLRDGDLVFSWSASLEVRVWNRGPAFLNQHLFRVVPANGIDNAWLRFALDAATRQFVGLMQGSAMTHITQPMMKLVRLPVPSPRRQRYVAEKLRSESDRVEQTVERLKRQISLLDEHRQAFVMFAVTGQLDLTKSVA